MKTKKIAIVQIIIFSIVALLLCGLLVCGIIFGSSMKFFGLQINTFDEKDYTVYSSPVNIDADKISTIDVEWTNGKIEIQKSPTEQITLSESSDQEINNKDALRYKIDGATLVVKNRKSQWFFGFGNLPSKNLTLLLPEKVYNELKIDNVSADMTISDCKFTNLDINNVSGKADLSNINVPNVKIDGVSGNTVTDNCVFDTFKADTISGEIDLSGTFNDKVDINTVSGKIIIISQICPKNIDTDSVSGDVKITIPEQSGFSANYNTVSGSFTSAIPTSLKDKTYTAGNGDANFSFNSTSGSVSIEIAR